ISIINSLYTMEPPSEQIQFTSKRAPISIELLSQKRLSEYLAVEYGYFQEDILPFPQDLPLEMLIENGKELGRLKEQVQTVSQILHVLREKLLKAAKSGTLEEIKILLDCGAQVDETEEDGWTPLHIATAGGHKEVVQLLIERGANVDAANKSGLTPLYAAA